MSAYELNALTLKLDDAGNTAAHVAVLKGREDMFKVRSFSVHGDEVCTILCLHTHNYSECICTCD